MNKIKVMWWGAGIIVVAVVVIAVISPFPPKDYLSGAVGVSKQYRSEQITDADVVLKDPEIQDLLQSDFFYKLATDKEFRQIAVDQLARLDMASGRTAQFTNTVSLADMDNFLALTADNADLRTALSEGRMDVVRKILIANGKGPYIDIANRIYMTQGRNPQINARAYADMRSFLNLTKSNVEMRNALADGRIEMVNRILVKDGKEGLQDAAGRVFLAESRCHFSGKVYAFADTKALLDLAKTNVELRNALTEGRMDIVRKVLLAEGRGNLEETAKRVYITFGRGPEFDAAGLDNMTAFIDLAADNKDLRVAFTDGRMDAVNKILVADGKKGLSEAVGRMYSADGRLQINNPPSFENMKAILDLAKTNIEMRNALADGRMDIVRKMLVADGKANLVDPANRISMSLGRNREINFRALAQMKSYVDAAAGNPDRRAALVDARQAADADQMFDAYLLIDGVPGECRVALQMTKSNIELKTALAEGRMDIVNKILVAEGRTNLENAFGRIYHSLGRSPEFNAEAVDQMHAVFAAVDGNADLRSALADGRLDIAQKVLVADGKKDLQDAAGRVVWAIAIENPVSRDFTLVSLRAASDFAADSADFRQALQDGKIEMAARVARAAGRSDISLRGLQITSFVVGNSRNYAADLNRLAAAVDQPAFRQAAENPGWGRVLATSEPADWKQTVEAVADGKMFVTD